MRKKASGEPGESTPVRFYAARFGEMLKRRRPDLAPFLIDPPRGMGWVEVFEMPRPAHPGQTLAVGDRQNAMEIAWSGFPTKGPAEIHLVEAEPRDEELVELAVDHLAAIVDGKIPLLLLRSRFLWFRPTLSARFLVPENPPPRDEIVEQMVWHGGASLGFEEE